MQEQWKPVPYEPFDKKYLISSFGRVKRIEMSKYSPSKNLFLKPAWGSRGRYANVLLYADGLKKQPDIHRMVALAFLDKPSQDLKLVRHLDGNTRNNRVDNLQWGNNTDNMRDMIAHGHSMRGELNKKSKLTEKDVRDIVLRFNAGETQTSLAAEYGINQTSISKILLHINWKHLTF